MNDSWNGLLMHEMAHVFARANRWEAEAETICDFFTAYVLENVQGARMGTAEETGYLHMLAVGRQFRDRRLISARRRFRENRMQTFSGVDGSAYCYKLLGLVDVVGWDTYKKVFRAYNDANYLHPFSYTGDPRTIRARAFFDMLAIKSGHPNLMSSLADRGQIFEAHFNNPNVIRVEERNSSLPSAGVVRIIGSSIDNTTVTTPHHSIQIQQAAATRPPERVAPTATPPRQPVSPSATSAQAQPMAAASPPRGQSAVDVPSGHSTTICPHTGRTLRVWVNPNL